MVLGLHLMSCPCALVCCTPARVLIDNTGFSGFGVVSVIATCLRVFFNCSSYEYIV